MQDATIKLPPKS